MASPSRSIVLREIRPLPILLDDIPILYEDEEEGDMGESNPHVDACAILHICLKAHLAGRPEYRVFANMNCYYRKGPLYPKTGSLPYVSPDAMVVKPSRDLGEDVTSYEISRDGPAPLLVGEVLSERSAQQRDLSQKLTIYAKLGVAEYLLVDTSGRFLPQRLLLKRLQPDRTWKDEQDPDGGVTSQLGFRVIIDTDGRLRVVDAATGKRYIRPDEATARVAEAEERIRELETELQRLRRASRRGKEQKPPAKRRRKS